MIAGWAILLGLVVFAFVLCLARILLLGLDDDPEDF